MKFLCLICAEPPKQVSEVEARQRFAEYAEFTDAIRTSGHYAGCNRLQPPDTAVTVRVRTVKGGDEITSWQVFYMPRVFEAAANASPDLFPQLSSPTEDTLVPGRYVMWARDPVSTRVGERTVVKVGEGKKELLLDLPVPAAPTR